jgi:hypothetical protein
MTVRELIEILNEKNLEATVRFRDSAGYATSIDEAYQVGDNDRDYVELS